MPPIAKIIVCIICNKDLFCIFVDDEEEKVKNSVCALGNLIGHEKMNVLSCVSDLCDYYGTSWFIQEGGNTLCSQEC